MSKISRITSKAVRLAKNAVGGGGFADYAIVSLHCPRIYLAKPYREAPNLLSEMYKYGPRSGLKWRSPESFDAGKDI
jgi:IS5 family transposase